MRNVFSAWYARDPEQLSALWDRALFVPDTNILLHCLRHSSDVRDELLRVFEVLKDSLWIPYQIGLEFHRNRLEVEAAAEDAYDSMIKSYEGILGNARQSLRQLRAHPSISVQAELAALDMFEQDFRARMERARNNHPRKALTDVLNRLASVFEGRVGSRPTPERLASIRKEGEERYAKRVPPGYKDAKKEGSDGEKFGDLIIWKELMEKAKTDRRPVILVTDDAKEDWWRIHRGRKLGPRPELLEEFRSHAEQDFHIYELGQFLRLAAERHREIAPASVEQIERSVREDDEARRRNESASTEAEHQAWILSLENQRDSMISALAGLPSFGSSESKEVLDHGGMRARLAEIDVQLAKARAVLARKSGDEDLDPAATAARV